MVPCWDQTFNPKSPIPKRSATTSLPFFLAEETNVPSDDTESVSSGEESVFSDEDSDESEVIYEQPRKQYSFLTGQPLKSNFCNPEN